MTGLIKAADSAILQIGQYISVTICNKGIITRRLIGPIRLDREIQLSPLGQRYSGEQGLYLQGSSIVCAPTAAHTVIVVSVCRLIISSKGQIMFAIKREVRVIPAKTAREQIYRVNMLSGPLRDFHDLIVITDRKQSRILGLYHKAQKCIVLGKFFSLGCQDDNIPAVVQPTGNSLPAGSNIAAIPQNVILDKPVIISHGECRHFTVLHKCLIKGDLFFVGSDFRFRCALLRRLRRNVLYSGPAVAVCSGQALLSHQTATAHILLDDLLPVQNGHRFCLWLPIAASGNQLDVVPDFHAREVAIELAKERLRHLCVLQGIHSAGKPGPSVVLLVGYECPVPFVLRV